ncbi:hypothetical protein QEH32_gp39 [Corynebacterium phage EmiRose]|uniref:DNA methylase N-4/N-6 domain-containing protein n=1 Tax=Corynebacterium phage EmiRose TaxID=2565372 RepID=A0A649VPJ1_9CAUD|nr:hypothetical protein QEH32_gp39 [Corynebacterium phage EmiRose]QGJ94171.1 hypothetical protein SEA_EMIROSE_39 [Corynebacterium phage EmiRose]
MPNPSFSSYPSFPTDTTPLVINAKCLDYLRTLPDNSIDSIVTDPPYGLNNLKPGKVVEAISQWINGDLEFVPDTKGFMNAEWDKFVPPPAAFKECLRVLKPGGYIVCFAGTRTLDLMGLSLRIAGFEVRDLFGWLNGNGWPKGINISKAIESKYPDEAEKWSGWNTTLKPALEPALICRKPIEGTVSNNVLKYGTGGMNIDATRVPSDEVTGWGGNGHKPDGASSFLSRTGAESRDARPVQGRWPANIALDDDAAAAVDEQSGESISRPHPGGDKKTKRGSLVGGAMYSAPSGHNDSGGASRFFHVFSYVAKAPKSERPVIVRDDGTKLQHSTVKPVTLMQHLVALITPPGGLVLDPFAGTGSTLEAAYSLGMRSIGIEQDSEYCQLIDLRLARAMSNLT